MKQIVSILLSAWLWTMLSGIAGAALIVTGINLQFGSAAALCASGVLLLVFSSMVARGSR